VLEKSVGKNVIWWLFKGKVFRKEGLWWRWKARKW